jgi:hypothetical protein
MTGLPLIRTEYWNLSIPGTVRSGSTTHGESLTDVESYLLPLGLSATSSLYTPGVADGLTVTATPQQPGVTVSPGVALDVTGHVIVLAVDGFAVIDPTVDPSQLVNVPTVPVPAAGVTVDSTGLTGDLRLTLTWAEVVEQGQLSNAPVLVHAPWLRLLPPGNVPADGEQVVLAGVTLDATGNVTGLSAASRVPVGLSASRLQIRRPRAAAGPPLSVDQFAAAEFTSGDDGGLTLDLTPAGGPLRVLAVDDAATTLSLLPGGGTVGIGLGSGPAMRILHAEGSEIHSGGPGGGFSFANRDTRVFVEQPTVGERWAWYAQGGQARLWSGEDRLSIDLHAEGGGLDVPRRMRVRQGNDASAGIWFFQSQQVQADRAFVGMADDNSVGFWGNTGAQWGLRMDTTSGNVGIGTASPSAKLDVQTPAGFAISGSGGPGFLGIGGGFFGRGPIGVLAQGTSTGIVASGGSVGISASSNGTAGQFQGNVTITGKLSKPGGGFTIDHPLDPENRYLSHSSVESPEMLNVYRGTVTTDHEGAATVELPGYMEPLNREFSYHLTVVGDFARAVVSAPVRDGRFGVRTDRPETTVCWLILGARADPWAEANPIEVEGEKPAAERNLFLHPELYSQPVTRGLLHSQYPGGFDPETEP